MEKTLPETLPSEGGDKSVGAKRDTEGADAVSGNNELVGYGKTYRQARRKEGDALCRLHLKVNEGELRVERCIGGGDGQGGASNVRVVSEGGEDTVRVSSGRRPQVEVGKGEEVPPKRVALTSARRRRQDVKARVVPAGPIEEREIAS